MLHLAQQNKKLELQLLKQEEEGIKKERAWNLAEMEEDNRSRLEEATLSELELIAIFLEAGKSL